MFKTLITLFTAELWLFKHWLRQLPARLEKRTKERQRDVYHRSGAFMRDIEKKIVAEQEANDPKKKREREEQESRTIYSYAPKVSILDSVLKGKPGWRDAALTVAEREAIEKARREDESGLAEAPEAEF